MQLKGECFHKLVYFYFNCFLKQARVNVILDE